MTGFDWTQVYPGRRIVTLVLDPEEAEELLDQAKDEGRMIAPATVLGMPAIAFGPEAEAWTVSVTATPAPETREALASLADAAARQLRDEPPTGDASPDPKIAILPVVRREPLPAPLPARTVDVPEEKAADRRTLQFDARSPLAEKPPARAPEPREKDRRYNPARQRWERRGEITPEDIRMIGEAVAEGRVTKCPPATFALDANDPANSNWKRRK